MTDTRVCPRCKGRCIVEYECLLCGFDMPWKPVEKTGLDRILERIKSEGGYAKYQREKDEGDRGDHT